MSVMIPKSTLLSILFIRSHWPQPNNTQRMAEPDHG